MKETLTHIKQWIAEHHRIVTDVPGDCSSCYHCRHLGKGYCYCSKDEGIETCQNYSMRFLATLSSHHFDWDLICAPKDRITKEKLISLLREADKLIDSCMDAEGRCADVWYDLRSRAEALRENWRDLIA